VVVGFWAVVRDIKFWWWRVFWYLVIEEFFFVVVSCVVEGFLIAEVCSRVCGSNLCVVKGGKEVRVWEGEDLFMPSRRS